MRLSSVRLWASDYYNPIKFTKDSTPLQFRNRICVKSSNGEDKYYDMNFYINEIGNVTSLQGLNQPTNFYIPYSSFLENTDDNEELFNQNSGRKASSKAPAAKNTSLSGAELVDHLYRRIDRAATGEELAEIKREIEGYVQSGKIKQKAANSLYEVIAEELEK